MSKTKRIFVGNIIEKVNAGSINSAFEEFGEITDININATEGSAYIGFEAAESAERAVEETNGTEIFGGLLNVVLTFSNDHRPPATFAKKQATVIHGQRTDSQAEGTQSSRLFVGNLSREVSKDELNAIFAVFGEINEVWIPFTFKGYCFISYENTESAKLAVEGMSGTEHSFSKELKVEITVRPKKPENPLSKTPSKFGKATPKITTPRLFVGNIKEEVDKATFRPLFEPYGVITDVWLAFNPPGFAFVEYEDIGSCRRAIEALNGRVHFGGKLKVDFTDAKGMDKKYTPGGRPRPYDVPPRERGRGRGRGRDRGAAAGSSLRRPPPLRTVSSRGRHLGRSLLPRTPHRPEVPYYEPYYEGSYEGYEGYEDPYSGYEEGAADSYYEDPYAADPYYPAAEPYYPPGPSGRARGGRGRAGAGPGRGRAAPRKAPVEMVLSEDYI